MDVSKPEILNIIEPSELVAEAVMKSIWSKIGPGDELEFQNKGSDNLLKERTLGLCKWQSGEVALDLASHPEDFKHIIVLETQDVKSESWLFENVSDRSDVSHSYFLAQDKYGYWYAGSPANHGANNDPSYATTIFRDKELSFVIEKIETRDNVRFMSAKEIEKILDSKPSFIARNRGQIEILHIETFKDRKNGSSYVLHDPGS